MRRLDSQMLTHTRLLPPPFNCISSCSSPMFSFSTNSQWDELGDQNPDASEHEGPLASLMFLRTKLRPGACGGERFSVQSASSPVHSLWSVVFAVQGASVWVFECCCLLFFKGLLALPWGCCSRNSYLCFSPAYRLLTGTKWKNTCS